MVANLSAFNMVNNMNKNKKITFRPFGVTDMPLVLDWFDQGEFYYYSTYPKYVAENEIESFLLQRGNTFIIEDQNSAVGLCDFHLLDVKGKCCNIEIAFANKIYYQQRGADILKMYLNLIFEHNDILKINKLVYGFDHKSVELCQHAGMVIEGAYEEHVFKNGCFYDLVYMAMLKEDLNL